MSFGFRRLGAVEALVVWVLVAGRLNLDERMLSGCVAAVAGSDGFFVGIPAFGPILLLDAL